MLVKVGLHGKVYVWLVKVGRYIMVNVFNGGAPVYLYIGALLCLYPWAHRRHRQSDKPVVVQAMCKQAFRARPEGGNEHIAQGNK